MKPRTQEDWSIVLDAIEWFQQQLRSKSPEEVSAWIVLPAAVAPGELQAGLKCGYASHRGHRCVRPAGHAGEHSSSEEVGMGHTWGTDADDILPAPIEQAERTSNEAADSFWTALHAAPIKTPLDLLLWAMGEGHSPDRLEEWDERKYKPWFWWQAELRRRFAAIDKARGEEK